MMSLELMAALLAFAILATCFAAPFVFRRRPVDVDPTDEAYGDVPWRYRRPEPDNGE